MSLTRREFLTLTGLATASALLASCTSVRELVAAGQQAPAPWPAGNDHAWHALNRLTFGPRADERARVAEFGLDAWI